MARDSANAAMVSRVAMAIAAVASEDEAIRSYFPQVASFKWEANLVESAQVNANCRPGGKIIVYTGLLPVTQTEGGLAAVIGHEVTHAVCRHSNERLSDNMIAQVGLAGFEQALGSKDPKTRAQLMEALGTGVQLGVLLPFSRTHESEADHLGLILMAKAGYDPRESEALWVRMSELSNGQQPPEFLSTHPSNETRIRQIQEWLPEALAYYSANPAPPPALAE